MTQDNGPQQPLQPGQPADPMAQPQQPQYGYPPQGQYPPQQPPYPQGPQYPQPPQPPQRPQQPPQQGQRQAPQVNPVANFDHSLVTTALELPAHTIVRNYGMVRGIMVRSRSVVGNIGAGFQQLFGGNISIYTEMCERARQDTYELMIQHAAALGANAVVAVHYDATEIAPGVTEVLCYGTAVTVVPK
ncbi:MAG TPA: YbjQ family protein [Ktedonobacterales bacterium]|nr:YbjQ family protein [Ktedonobacterales bacterium]